MNIFDIINGVAFDKKADLINQTEDEKAYAPFLVNRWLSMLDGSAARIVNETLNRFGGVFTSAEQYKFLVHVLPLYKRQRINYIKKPKVDA